MSLAKILAARKRKRNFYDGGPDFADGSGSIDGGYGGGSPDPGGNFSDNDAAQFGTPTAPAGTGAPYDGATSGGKPGESAQAQAAATAQPMPATDYAALQQAMIPELSRQYAETLQSLLPSGLGMLGKMSGMTEKAATALATSNVMNTPYGSTRPGSEREYNEGRQEGSMGSGLAADAAANPFGSSTPVQTTPAAPADAGMRRYVWDPVARQYTLTNVGAGDNPMGYTQGQTFRMAAGGPAPSGLAAARTQPRFVQGGGTGLSDDVPVKMDDGGDGRLADGEFVVPADVVSGLGGGSSKAGADMLYQMMERIRQQAHGKSQQIRPVDPGQVLPA